MTHDAATIRSRLGHPVVDSDGHLIEFLPLVEDFLTDVADRSVANRYRSRISERPALASRTDPGAARRDAGLFRTGVWVLPTENTLDRATAMLPELAYHRLDELGIDFALVYSTYGIGVINMPDDELRPAVARALNRYYAEVYAGLRDRLEPVAVIPTVTPSEAIAELNYAVEELGLKAVMMAGVVPRKLAGWAESRSSMWVDTLGHDSTYDYDPLWARCVELGVVPTFHAGGQGWGTRMSTTNNVYNQLGNFAAAGEAGCRSLLMGGAPLRFPSLRFAFLEGGVTYAWQLLQDCLHSYEKRNRGSMRHYDPARVDLPLLQQLFDQYGHGVFAKFRDRLSESVYGPGDTGILETPDDWAESLVNGPADILDVFARQFVFGCEADDPGVHLAFRGGSGGEGRRLNAMFASDIGHWDVPDMREVLPEAWEFVESGSLTEAEFSDFAFGNVTRMLTAADPAFFDGTAIADQVRASLAVTR